MLRPLSTFLSWVNKQHAQNPIYPVSVDEIDCLLTFDAGLR